MKATREINSKILPTEAVVPFVKRSRLISKSIAFTNGVFDILHRGHIRVLSEAANFADLLVVGINSDASVKRLKGESRPVNDESSRALIMASLVMVDAVVIFGEDTPLELIKKIEPDVLVKGGDYSIETIVGAKEVLQCGGQVKVVSLEAGYSTTGIIDRFKQ